LPLDIENGQFSPRHSGGSPHFLKGLFQTVKESERWIVEAVLHKSYKYALQSLTINPLVPSLETARAYLDKLFRAEKLDLH
jgi:6-phospho-beta-glucosidase